MHLATVHDNFREFMCFIDKQTQKVYIEEISGGSLQFIEDDQLAHELAAFLTMHKVLDVTKEILP